MTARGKVPVESGKETKIDFDVKADRAKMGIDEEEVKKYEEAKAANENIKSLNAMLAQVRDLMKADNYDQAIALLQPAAEKNPQQDLIWGYLGDAYVSAKKYPEAIDAYNKAIALKPKDGGYLSGLANAYAKTGQTDKAVENYNAAAQAEPANAATYYFNEGAVFTNTGKVDDAIAAFDKVIALDPEQGRSLLLERREHGGQGNHGQGRKVRRASGNGRGVPEVSGTEARRSHGEAAKQMLASIGASVETSYGKGKSTSKTPPKKQ